MFYQKKKNIQNKYYTLFLRCNQVLVLVETPISLMVLFLHINIKKNHKKQFKVYEKNHKTSIKTVYLIILFYR